MRHDQAPLARPVLRARPHSVGPGCADPGAGRAIRTEVPTLGWQVVHGSRDTLGRPNALSGTVLLPRAAWPGPGPRPVLSYGVGVHGLGRDAAPSHLLRSGQEAELPIVERALAHGWAVAVSDGEGLGLPGPHTYGAGRAGGHALLDVARAALRLVPELSPESPVFLLRGYSEGGRNATWAAELQPTYAAELALVGVAAGGVPADLYRTALAIDGGPYSGLNLAVLVGLANAYDDPQLWSILSSEGLARSPGGREPRTSSGLVLGFPEPLATWTRRDDPWDDPAWRRVLDRERNGAQAPDVPAYLYHVMDDEIVPSQLGRTSLASTGCAGATSPGWRSRLPTTSPGRTRLPTPPWPGWTSGWPSTAPLQVIEGWREAPGGRAGFPTFVEALAVLALQPFSRLLRAELIEFSTGRAVLRLPVRAALAQQHGQVHGGVVAYVADCAIAFAGGSVLGASVATGGLSLQYVRPASGSELPGGGRRRDHHALAGRLSLRGWPRVISVSTATSCAPLPRAPSASWHDTLQIPV